MKDISDPLDYLIQCCESTVNTGHCKFTQFTILNAKDELRRLREKTQQLSQQLIQINNLLSAYENVAWARINDRGDLYDVRLIYNNFVDESTIIPLYSNMKEFKEKYDKPTQ